jgi:hypothetical protein
MANSHRATLKKSVNPSQLPTNKSQTPARQTVTNKSNSNPSQPGSKDDDRLQLPEKIIPSATQTPRVHTQPCEKITTQVHWNSSRDARINGTLETLEAHQTATQQPNMRDFSGKKGPDPKMTLGASKKTVDQEPTLVFNNTQKPQSSTQEQKTDIPATEPPPPPADVLINIQENSEKTSTPPPHPQKIHPKPKSRPTTNPTKSRRTSTTPQNPTKVSTPTNKSSKDIETFSISKISVNSNPNPYLNPIPNHTNPVPSKPALPQNNRYKPQTPSTPTSTLTQPPKTLKSIQEIEIITANDGNDEGENLGVGGYKLPDLKGGFGGYVVRDLEREVSVGFGGGGESWCGAEGRVIVKSEILGKLVEFKKFGDRGKYFRKHFSSDSLKAWVLTIEKEKKDVRAVLGWMEEFLEMAKASGTLENGLKGQKLEKIKSSRAKGAMQGPDAGFRDRK